VRKSDEGIIVSRSEAEEVESAEPSVFERLIGRLTEGAKTVVRALHRVALDNGCRYRARPGDWEGRHTVEYSARP
jgi:hypothetical protein